MKYIFIAFILIFHVQTAYTQTFIEVKKDFPKEEKNLRKWDAPVIADLDQDGHVDLILNDHGFGVKVLWNNNGRFAPPYDIIMGDLHGISVGDFDMNGELEIIISRGGGSGSNARNSKVFRVDKQRNFTALPDFDVPLELMRGRTVKFMDADNDGDLDLFNFAFPDKDKKGKSENYVYENDGKGQLILHSALPPSQKDGQKTLVSDFNNDDLIDLFIYGNDRVKVYQGKGDLSYQEVTKDVFPFDITKVTSIVEIDYDNDGDFDLFLTRGKEFEIGETFYDPTTKIWGFYTKRGSFKFEDLVIGDVLNIENYHAQWPDNDAFFIGETGYDYAFPGETHSGRNIRLVNSDALGFPDKLSKRGAFIGYVGNRSWRFAGNLWAPSTGVIHGVRHYSEYDHPKGLRDILLKNDNGKFIEVTQEVNLSFEEHTTGATVADLDNNGFQDLLVVRRGDLIHENRSLIFLNQGGDRFEKLAGHNVVAPELGAIGLGAETLDYNRDGKVDVIIGNERGKWHLFKNTTPKNAQNNYLIIEVGTSPTGKATGLGALVSISSCHGKQVQRVGSTGANYSLSFDRFLHFGLGKCNETVAVKVTWTNGETQEYKAKALNKNIFLGK